MMITWYEDNAEMGVPEPGDCGRSGLRYLRVQRRYTQQLEILTAH